MRMQMGGEKATPHIQKTSLSGWKGLKILFLLFHPILDLEKLC